MKKLNDYYMLEEHFKIIMMYIEGQIPTTKIAVKLNCGHHRVRSILKRYNIPIFPKGYFLRKEEYYKRYKQ
jgi:hypothetical protein